MNSPKGVKSGGPERVSISCPTGGTRHDLTPITGNQSYVTFSDNINLHNINIFGIILATFLSDTNKQMYKYSRAHIHTQGHFNSIDHPLVEK